MSVLSEYTAITVLHQNVYRTIARAQRIRDQLPVLFKIASSSVPNDHGFLSLKYEYEILRSFQSDCVIRAHDLIQAEGRLILVLEDFGSSSLDKYLEYEPFDLRHRLYIALQIANSLVEIHGQKILHLDLKPHHIVVNSTQAKLIDFANASRLSYESQEIASPSVLRGTLAYMAPEQTGRMNHTVDARADLYSLGITLFELFTNRLPFLATDPLELIHCHIAQKPPYIQDINPKIPHMLSTLVAKLLSKSAEQRYQTAVGVRADLARCLDILESSNFIPTFSLGQHDHPLRIELPQRLYGREEEQKTLTSTYHSICDGKSGFMLIRGPSGIGKTSLIYELLKPLTQQHGYFLSGKCDQLKRSVPYASIVQAFRGLFRQILTESELEVEQWKKAFLQAWGSSGQIMIELLPEIEFLIGKQPPVIPLGPTESQYRFHTLFDRGLSVFSNLGRPLILFLDDLQWADIASLELLQHILTPPGKPYFLLVGAYRDNEVDSTHPFELMISKLQTSGLRYESMYLEALHRDAINQLLADTLRINPVDCHTLTALMLEKTAGNPFFIQQSLRLMHDENLLYFDKTNLSWVYSIEQLKESKLADNVAEVLIQNLRKLRPETQDVLQIAACFGNNFNIEDVRNFLAQTSQQTIDQLAQGVDEGFIIPIRYSHNLSQHTSANQYFRFSHDRIQQAAYLLIDKAKRAQVHYHIGQQLLEHVLNDEATRIFEIVDHLNEGVSEIKCVEQRLQLAKLNVEAGVKAKASTAYQTAYQYFCAGMALLPVNSWNLDYKLTYKLSLEKADCEYLIGNFFSAEEQYEKILKSVQNPLEKAEVLLKEMVLLVTCGRNWDVLDRANQAFEFLGHPLAKFRDAQAMREAVIQEFTFVEHLLRQHAERIDKERPDAPFKILDLLRIESSGDARYHALLEILMAAIPPAYFFGEDIFKLVILKIVSLSLLHGNIDSSSFGYVLFAHVLGSERGDFTSGYNFGKLGLAVAERFHSPAYIGKANYMMGAFVNHWTQPISTNLPYLAKGHTRCVEAGELIWAGYAGSLTVWTMDARGDLLSDVDAEAAKYYSFAQRTKHNDLAWDTLIPRRRIAALTGTTQKRGSFSDIHFDEAEQRLHIEKLEKKIPLNLYHIYKAETLFIFEYFTEALYHARASHKIIWGFAGMILFTKHHFYYGLILAANHTTIDANERSIFESILDKFHTWASNCPTNFQHQHLLLRAEQARIEGDCISAMSLYDEAIETAHHHHFVHEEALASNLATRFYIGLHRTRLARLYWLDARANYLLWGATEKVRQLDETYPWVSTEIDPTTHSSLIQEFAQTAEHQAFQSIDLTTIVRAAQTISKEIVFDRLLIELMKIVAQNAGAEHAVLILQDGGQYFVKIKIHSSSKQNIVLKPEPFEHSSSVPQSIINYALRTGHDILINDINIEPEFTKDPYIIEHKPRSVLCVQIQHQSKSTGLLYLENSFTDGSFTNAHLTIVQLLAAQAAISIENAKLYTQLEEYNHALEQKVHERTQELTERNHQLNETLHTVVITQQKLVTELSEAAVYVRSLLPKPMAGPLQVQWKFLPSTELGGDAFGYHWVDEHRFAVYLLDVCGHGIASTLFAVSVLTSLQNERLQGIDFQNPSSVLSGLNKAFSCDAQNGLYFTIWYGVYDVEKNILTYASAGHPPALLISNSSNNTTRILELETRGTMIGITSDVFYPSAQCTLQSHDRIFIYSDGAYEIERPNGTLINYEEFLMALRAAVDQPKSALESMVQFAYDTRGASTLADDFSMIEIKIP